MDVHDLSPRLRLVRFGFVQAYLWRDGNEVTLVDTGPVGSATAIADALADWGLDLDAVRSVVLTHFHEDHVGSAAEIATWPNATILAHHADAPYITGVREGPSPNFSPTEQAFFTAVVAGQLPSEPVRPVRVDRELDDGDVLAIGDGAVVHAVPGHTEGSIGIEFPHHRLLFTGDVIAEVNGQVLRGTFNLDGDQTTASFRRLARLEVETVCFGHGDPVLRDGSSVLRAAAEGPTTFEGLSPG